MNEGQIYRAECIKLAIDYMEMLVTGLGLANQDHAAIMKNAEIIKHHAVALMCKSDEWERPE